MKCHLDLPLLSKKVTAKKKGETKDRGGTGNKLIRLKEKMDTMNRQNQMEFERERETGRDRENRRKEGNCRKRGSLVRHYPQSNPQFQVRRNTERE